MAILQKQYFEELAKEGKRIRDSKRRTSPIRRSFYDETKKLPPNPTFGDLGCCDD